LKGYRLAFTRKSSKRKCGVADAVCDPQRAVWGAVYELNEDDLRELDRREGCNPERASTENSYNRRKVTILVDGDESQPWRVWTYFATPQKNPPPPNSEYKRLIVEGARTWGLPEDYIKQLEAMDDPEGMQTPRRSGLSDCRCVQAFGAGEVYPTRASFDASSLVGAATPCRVSGDAPGVAPSRPLRRTLPG
jgi:gamma-glutamylcyclotransferase (GGCT)/AIG2-like uncharacterized protein YtfP